MFTVPMFGGFTRFAFGLAGRMRAWAKKKKRCPFPRHRCGPFQPWVENARLLVAVGNCKNLGRRGEGGHEVGRREESV